MHKQMTIGSSQWEVLIFVCVFENEIRMRARYPNSSVLVPIQIDFLH